MLCDILIKYFHSDCFMRAVNLISEQISDCILVFGTWVILRFKVFLEMKIHILHCGLWH
jgi:exosortase/archaeosortase